MVARCLPLTTYNFDQVLTRTNAGKWLDQKKKFGTNDLLSFWIADMDFQSPQPVIDAIKERAEEGIYGYAYRPESYFTSFQDWFLRRHTWNVKEDWLIHTPLAMTAITLYIQLNTQPGDKIILQPPMYYPFFDIIKKLDREVVVNPLKLKQGKYVMDYEDLEAKIVDENVKMFVLCNPHNPVGRVWKKEELLRLGEICYKHQVKVIADEVHSDFTFGDHTYIPFASLSETNEQHSITIVSPSKTFNLAGLQQSIAIVPNREIFKAMKKQIYVLDMERNNCFSVVATEAGYRYGEDWLRQLLDYMEKNIEFAIKYCEENIPEIKPNRPEGTYLVWLDCKGLGLKGEALNTFFVEQAKVGLASGHWFGTGGEHHARLNIGCPRSILKEGLERIKRAVQERTIHT